LNFSHHFLELAKKEEKDLYRKNLYTLVGYAKSPQFSFEMYQIEYFFVLFRKKAKN